MLTGMDVSELGLRTRPLTYVDGVVDPGDLAEAVRLVIGCESAVVDPPDTSPADVAGMLAVPSMDREASCFLLDGDEIVGLLWVEKDPFEGVTGLETYSVPWPSSAPVRAQALSLGLEAARRHRTEAGSSTWKARSGGYVVDTDHLEVMTAAGMNPARRFYRMRIESGSPSIPEVAPELPEGVEIVVRDDDETRRAIHRIDNESFSEHWGWAEHPYDDWWQHWEARPSRDPQGWWLLTVDGEPAAICLLDENNAERGEGYVAVLGVLKQFRGRGLAPLLLRRAFVHYRDLGRTATQLGVDATNTTGAVALYEKVGMRPARIVDAYEHPLD
jgi:ribosomal protein S18 acetylase RimI-like enzyme